ncbi:hypothetical protein FHS61_000880 [Altererythrobacter atlanticus]|uniref:GNAT family N-acetyltransferase n=1 Tax=Croceibacterium atlanticum TaxID=1267766 RepID=UPI00062C8ABD|nr:GNAT family N-acetyltransferase [Croceibacterium atlanticum]MBB5731876.1 hypothetical protein [Croceibacterium atlanticum]
MASKVEISREDDVTHGAYRADVPGTEKKAELTWRARGKARIAEHTFVPPEARGMGIAMQLVEALVEDARKQDFTVVPQCSYVEMAFRRNPDWADIRAEIES